ncbi:MAG: Rieske 2Fe-2S domain-containing protein [Gammaproteobacteria bacterium]|nr:Rieske 2Fe-2S domain-containing protein [Gammaproteobacteria bacterium]MBU1603147.1 Rieske 2Fe-2S domain-containing protein [Gammaproteobacteria bacterium]MBU2432667.1 Rieske 2Fe-2S domain-containing protein [Gammaproteobacteria bacterium]MBU2451498.1 Rieske 2Fe-2S domain-containing protein [Gammaproteobacteria bacterium]
MASGLRLICASEELAEGGRGVRFAVDRYGRQAPAFVIRFHGKAYAYLNECGHVPAELDWLPGEFFDDSKLYLICSIHGALYAPESGRCLGGRCQGKGLKSLKVIEINGQIFIEQENNHG